MAKIDLMEDQFDVPMLFDPSQVPLMPFCAKPGQRSLGHRGQQCLV